jgi:YD repeat-containing protein
MESYDPHTGKVKFIHFDGSVKSSESLRINFYRRSQRNGQAKGSRIGNWNLTFGGVIRVNNGKRIYTNGSQNKTFCEEARSRPFITPSGMVKEFGTGSQTPDGWRRYCWYAGEAKDPFNEFYIKFNNPRDRDEVVFISPDGTKYIVGKKYSQTARPASGNASYSEYDEWVVTRVESAAGDWYNINYGTEEIISRTRKKSPNHLVTIHKVLNIELSDGSRIYFDYEKNKIYGGVNSDRYRTEYEVVIIDKIRYQSKVMVDYEYDTIEAHFSNEASRVVLSKTILPDGLTWKYGKVISDSSSTRFAFTSPTGVMGSYVWGRHYLNHKYSSYLESVKYSGAGVNHSLSYTYSYKTNKKNYIVDSSITNGQTFTKYVHWGNHNTPNGADLYKLGTTKEILNYSDKACTSLVAKTIFTHSPIKFSNSPEVRILGPETNRTTTTYRETRLPVVANRRVEHYNSGGTDVFETAYSNFDAYRNPTTIVETYSSTGHATQTRTTTQTYQNNTATWVFGLPDTTTISDIASTINNDYLASGLLKKSNHYGLTNRYSYQGYGNLYQHTDPLGNLYTYSDYKKGVAQSVSGPESYAVARTVDDFGNITSETKWGSTTDYGYDNSNRLISVTTPDTNDFNVAIGYTENANGTLQTVTRGLNISESQYNGFGQLTSQKETVAGVTAGTSSTTTTNFGYDAVGNRTFVSYPNTSSIGTTTAYDGLGRITTVTQRDGSKTSFGYLAGNRVSVTDAQGNKVINTYLSWGSPGEKHLVKTEQPATSANTSALLSAPITTDIGRNKLGLIEYVNQGGFTQTYAYTSNWQLDYVTTPEMGKTDYTYDANGNLKAKQQGGNTGPKTLYSYDGLNRLDFVNYPAPAQDVDYHYNTQGQLAWVSKGPYKWSYGYTTNGVMNSETLADSSSNKRWAFGYGIDYYDHVASLTYPNGNAIAFKPDTAGRPTQAGAIAEQIRYHPTGSLAGLTFGNGRIMTIGLDSLQRTSNVTVDHSVMDLNYAYYQDNNIKSITDGLNSANTLSMQYDQHQRLRKVTGALWGSGALSYDATGNIKTKSIGGRNLNYNYSSTTNRLASVSGGKGYNFSYDSYGNVTGNGGFTFTYEHDGSMIDAQDNSSNNLFEYGYDAYNRRVKATQNGVLEKYSVYNSAGQLLLEEDKDGFQTNFVYAAGQRLAAIADCPDTDTDQDTIRDCDEKQLGFDPQDPTDGAGDYDGDGLSNAYEFNNGLNMSNADTDGDGMVDGWEVRNGLNPKTNDADSDKDGDGLSNIQEYTLGTAANNVDTDSDGVRDNADDQPLFNLGAFLPVIMLLLN